MLKKGLKELMAEANAAVETLDMAAVQGLAQTGDAVIVDVREGHEREKGYIPGSVHAPRGFLEFIADPNGPMHNQALAADKTLVLYCGTGGRAALAAKTLQDMGFPRVCNLAGGLKAWAEAGGELES